jgi:rare lipoprotein A
MHSGLLDSTLQNRPDLLGVDKSEAPRSVTTPNNVHVGVASWYGPGFSGKKTASGDIFDETKFTAAHKTLPLGSKARVTHLGNRKSVEVLINDRGPFVEGRMIDLSHSAAKALGMIDNGIAKVQVELLQEAVVAENAQNVNRY